MTRTLRVALTALLALFVAGAVVLSAVVPNLYLISGRAKQSEYAAIADLIVERVAAHPDSSTFATALADVRQRFGIDAIAISVDGEPTFTAGVPDPATIYREDRVVAGRRLEIRFTDRSVKQLARVARIVAIAATVATVCGLIGLMVALFTFFRSTPDDAIEGAPGGTPTYLIQTFETSIQALRGRETTLRELHDQQKARADTLATITQTLVRSLTSGFISIDENGLVLDMNQAACELLGVSTAAAVEGRAIEDALGHSPFVELLQQAADGRATLQRVEVHQNDEAARTIGLTTVPLLDESGRYLGMLALFTDLTEVRQLERRLREMQSLADLGEMSAGIAHEFRNSLSTVLGYLKLARRSSIPPEADERMKNAETEARLLTEAVESLLTFARPMKLQMHPVDVTELVAEIAERLRPLWSTVRFDVDGGPLVVDGDAALLGRAFENLMRNAAEAIGERGGAGCVEVRVSGKRVVVRDDGVGIDEDEAPRLFLPFRSTKPNGFGLGLALTKKIVLLHGGAIRMTGKKGEGTTVTVDLDVLG